MAIINKRSGYYGFTYNPSSSGGEDSNGQVNKCLISIVYPLQENDVNFSITTGEDDWAIQMGDGTIIPVVNPDILYQNRDSSIVEFTMKSPYPSNSPCFLVYRSDKASFRALPRSVDREFVPNSISGNFAFTVEGYGGSVDANGQVNRIVSTISFPMQTTDVDFSITTDPSHWGARMPDGTMINLRDPIVLTANRDNAVVQFTMDKFYPSNAPCIIVYRVKAAAIRVIPRTASETFVPVSDITDVPTTVTAGVPVDLSGVTIKPYNASVQGIKWSIDVGDGYINESFFTSTSGGTVQLKATIIEGGINGTDFVKTFTIKSVADISVILQPLSTSVSKGNITEYLETKGSITGGILKYQWYSTPDNNNNSSNAKAIAGATNTVFNIPKDLGTGQWYYFCKISDAANTMSVKTNIAVVVVETRVTGIEVDPAEYNLGVGGNLQLTATVKPSDASNKRVKWTSSNINIATVDQIGIVESTGGGGDVRITATTDDGGFSASCLLHAQVYVPVTDITGIPEIVKVGTDIDLSRVIVINNTSGVNRNPTYTKIDWSIRNALNTGANISGNILHIPKLGDGAILIRATITDGRDLGLPFIKEWRINIEASYIAVEDIFGLPEKGRVNTPLALSGIISPHNATKQNIVFRVKYQEGTNSIIDNGILLSGHTGTVVLEARIKDGLSPDVDFVKEFTVLMRGDFVAVEGITDLPTRIYINHDQELTATVLPENATNKDIEWSIVDPGTTGADIEGNVIYAPRAGTLKLRATIYAALADGEYINGEIVYVNPDSPEAQRDPFVYEFTATVSRFVAVTDIRNVPTSYLLTDGRLELDGTVYPSSATNKEIIWSIVSTNGTGARLTDGYILTATRVGTVKIRATIKNGKNNYGINSDFTKDFNINIQSGFVSVTDITELPNKAYWNTELELTATVLPENATNKDIEWSITNDNGTSAHIADDNIFICPTDSSNDGTKSKEISLRATIPYNNGLTFTKDFKISVVPADKSTQEPPETFDLEFVKNGDTFNAVAKVISNAEYSFDEGDSWSTNNVLTGVDYNTNVSVMVRYKETSTHYASLAITVTGTSPMDTVKDPVFNPEDGNFSGTLSVTITCATPGATILYTTDGERPTSDNSSIYNGPITINETTHINAYAIKDGMNDSEIVSGYYVKS